MVDQSDGEIARQFPAFFPVEALFRTGSVGDRRGRRQAGNETAMAVRWPQWRPGAAGAIFRTAAGPPTSRVPVLYL
jgi:hypothetical protein